MKPFVVALVFVCMGTLGVLSQTSDNGCDELTKSWLKKKCGKNTEEDECKTIVQALNEKKCVTKPDHIHRVKEDSKQNKEVRETGERREEKGEEPEEEEGKEPEKE